MNNAKLWLVVKPTVGIPVFLSAVAVGSFAVHVAVLSNTSWVSDFLQGQPMGTGDQTAALTIDVPNMDNVNRASFETIDGVERLVVVLPDGRRAVATIEQDTVVAQAPDNVPKRD